jgi:hypothetical protein
MIGVLERARLGWLTVAMALANAVLFVRLSQVALPAVERRNAGPLPIAARQP